MGKKCISDPRVSWHNREEQIRRKKAGRLESQSQSRRTEIDFYLEEELKGWTETLGAWVAGAPVGEGSHWELSVEEDKK